MNIENEKIEITLDEIPINGGLASLGGPPLKREDILFKNIDKTIEIVTVPKLADATINQKNVAIKIDENTILEILSNHYQNVKITEINTLNDLKKMAARKPDLVFSGVKYFDFGGKELWLNDYLDFHGIAYMASSRKALNSEFDKSLAKKIVQNVGVATAHFFTTGPGEHPTEESIPIAYPLFVKPIAGGDSRGIDASSVVIDFAGFLKKVDEIHNTQQSRCLVETFLSGKEYSVGILEDRSTGDLTAMPIEIIAEKNKNGHRILDFDIKRNDHEKVVAVTDMRVHKQISDLAKAAFKALSGKSFGRIDVKMNHNRVPHFIEANLMPGLRKGYFYRACLLNLNMSYEQMILKIANSGLSYK